MSIAVGSIVEGVITGITNFGAFVLLPDGETGLVHISEVADAYVKDINEYFKKEDRVKVKVLSIDGKKIGLSLRQAKPGSGEKKRSQPAGRRVGMDFEDKLSRFLKESDERLQDLKKNTESKRGGRGSSYHSA